MGEQGYNATVTRGMDNVHEAASTQMAATYEAASLIMLDHSTVAKHPMLTVETTAQVMPEHSVVVEHQILTVVESPAMGHIVGLASTFTRIIVESHGNTIPMVVETAAQVHLLCYISSLCITY